MKLALCRLALVLMFATAITSVAHAQLGCAQQSQSALLGQFSDNAPAGSIQPSSVRNVICSGLNVLQNLADVAQTWLARQNLNAQGRAVNTVDLRSKATADYPDGIIRETDGTAGAPPLGFMPDTGGVCSADDIGHCVAANGGGYWLSQPNLPEDVREYSAPNDGATDAGPAINKCLAVESACLIPATTNGFFINTTISNPNGALVGTFVSTSDQNGFTYPGSSFLLCSTTVTPCVLMGNGGATKGSPSISNIIVSRAGGTPAAGTIGIEWWDVYGPYVSNVMARNSDTCVKFFYDNNPGFAGSSAGVYGLRVSSCGTHYIDLDGWPEIMFFDGRVGKNGGGDYPAQDYVYFEDSVANNSNVNTVSFFGTQFNTGTAADVPACFFRWGNFAVGAATISEDYKFIGVHAEGGTGGPRTGVICSDSTVSRIGALNISNSEMNANDGTTPFFALNSNTEIDDWHLNNNTFAGCHDMTLAPAPTGSVPGFHSVSITNNFGCNQTSYTSSGTHGNTLISTGNQWGSTQIAGNWDLQLVMNELSYGTITDTATGHVYMSEPWQTYTPVLEMGGAAGAWTLSTAVASYQRTMDGGFNVRFNIKVGTTDPATTGNATLNGIPLTCVTGVNAGSPLISYVFSSLTNVPSAYISADNFLNFVHDNGSGTSTSLTNTNFNSTSDGAAGMVHCTQAQ